MVINAVCAPIRAAAEAASQPAWPAPITTMSKPSSKTMINYRLLANAKGGKDSREYIFGGCLASNVAEKTKRVVQAHEDNFLARAGFNRNAR